MPIHTTLLSPKKQICVLNYPNQSNNLCVQHQTTCMVTTQLMFHRSVCPLWVSSCFDRFTRIDTGTWSNITG